MMDADEPAVVAVLMALWRQRAMSIDALAEAAGINQRQARAAVESLEKRCGLERSPGGVELVASGLGIWRDVLEQTAAEQERRLGRQVRVYQSTASTNDACWAAAGQHRMEGLVVLADEQTAGRGRRGNAWMARAGQSVLMSVLLGPMDLPAETLTLLAGLATAEGIEETTGRECEIKWPNDILIGGKKIAGILVERRDGAAVIGVGINAAQHVEDFPEHLRHRAGSLWMACGRRVDRLEVIQRVLVRLEERIFSQTPWLDDWKRRCGMLGTDIELRTGGVLLCGRVVDVDPAHGLALRDAHGVTHWCSAMTSTIGGA